MIMRAKKKLGIKRKREGETRPENKWKREESEERVGERFIKT